MQPSIAGKKITSLNGGSYYIDLTEDVDDPMTIIPSQEEVEFLRDVASRAKSCKIEEGPNAYSKTTTILSDSMESNSSNSEVDCGSQSIWEEEDLCSHGSMESPEQAKRHGFEKKYWQTVMETRTQSETEQNGSTPQITNPYYSSMTGETTTKE
jgi:hypothetical protein